MSAKIEAPVSWLDHVKLGLAVLMLLAPIVGFYWFDEYALAVRVVGVLLGLVLGLFIAAQTPVGRSALAFARESQLEVRKVVWPTRAETMQATLAVVIMVIIMGILLWLFDMFLLWAVRGLTGQGG